MVEAAFPRFMFSLAGVYSNDSNFADQRRLIEDLEASPGWDRDGVSAIAEAPGALIYLFHYLHGALCIELGEFERAHQLARTVIPRRGKTEPLWRHIPYVGFPDLFNINCTWAWEYLKSLYARRKELETFFASQFDFDVGLAGYSALLTVIELGNDIRAGIQLPTPSTASNFRLVVPPMFTHMSERVLGRALARKIHGRAVPEPRFAQALA